MSRRTSWTLIICSVVLGLTLPIGAYGAVGTVFNLSDASRTGPDGDARILNNKLGTTLCDVRTTGVTTANCVKVSAGRLLTAGQEPPNLFAAGCLVALQELDGFGECRIDVPPRFVIESVSISGFHRHGDDMYQCRIWVPRSPTTRAYPLLVPMQWVGSDDLTAFFTGSLSPHVHGVRRPSGEGLEVGCSRELGGSAGDIEVDIAGYSY